jgi:hypothetical protein
MLALAAGAAVGVAQMALAGPWHPGESHPRGFTHIIYGGHGGGSGGGFGGGGGVDSFPVTENFDSYTAGSSFPCSTPGPNCTGTNGWTLWGMAETSTGGSAGPIDGTISTTHAHSGANSLGMTGNAVDIVQTGNVTAGQWQISVWTYVASGASGANDNAYIIVLNQYVPPFSTFPPGNWWSIQVEFNKTTGMVVDNNTGTPYVAIVRDQWALVQISIDIGADTYSVNYNGAAAWGPLPYSTGFTTGGAHAIAALDLFSDESTNVWYDDVTVAPVAAPCYPNCDGSTTAPCLNVLDFGCFLNRFAAGDTYANCDNSTTPPILNVLDFGCFLNAFAAGCSSC